MPQLISLPGFGKPLTARKGLKGAFPSAILEDDIYEAPLLPVREYTMMELMNRATDKTDWDRKILDPTIASKWKEEALAADGTADTEGKLVDISPKMVNWCIEELKYKTDVFRQFNCVEALDGVWKSDTIIPESLRLALLKATRPLEDVPEKEKDWHPGSDEQVLDLVHPSIHPLVYGQSKILPNNTCNIDDCMLWIGKGQTLKAISAEEGTGKDWSNKYQWLPSDFEAKPDIEDVKILSYINNLHPKRHQDLYSIIPQIVAKAIPLWNRVLANVTLHQTVPPRVTDWSNSYWGYADEEEPDRGEDEDSDHYSQRRDEWMENRTVVPPEPEEFKTPAQRISDDYKYPYVPPDLKPCVDLRKDFKDLQIIVKLANIYLTPEKPNYYGGSWHVEGEANESICATALYYYSSENISESLLAFRQQVLSEHDDLEYAQNDFRALETIFNFENQGPSIQDLGAVVTRQGRLLCFPNVMQHRVHPFHLVDPTKPGHRKILALFLVDPHLPIISTANIPPQQKAWWCEEVEKVGALNDMPVEIRDSIFEAVDEPISLEEAKAQREELMEERKHFMAYHGDFRNLNYFNLCEH